MFSKSILITAVLCALVKIPKIRACDGCCLVQIDSTFDYSTTFDIQRVFDVPYMFCKSWFMWMTNAAFTIETLGGVSYCTTSNYSPNYCASVTTTFDYYESTSAVSYQTFGVVRDAATLQMTYLAEYIGDLYFANTFQLEGLILYNGDVAYVELNDGEVSYTETGYTLMAVDCVDNPNVLIVWYDCGSASVLISESLYCEGTYGSYYDAVISLLAEYGFDTTGFYTVEFPY